MLDTCLILRIWVYLDVTMLWPHPATDRIKLMLHGVAPQALFRKIAAALPGMESLSATKQEDLVDVNLSDKATSRPAAAAQQCQC